MTTDELFSAIERGGGRAIIGLKDSMAPGGFDERGIKLADRAATSRAKSRLRALGVSFDYEFKLDDPVVIARVSRPLLERLRRHPFVDYVEPNVSVQVASDSLPWNIVRVNAGLAQAYSQGAGVKLLIMDTGADLTNPDLHYSVSWRCVDGSSVSDATGHGTHVAGIAAAQVNGSGIVGVAPQVTLMSANVRRLGTVGEIDLNEVACSINVARANGVFAVNMSFGGPTSVQTTAVNDQIAAGYNQNGMIFVAATGNTVSNGGPVYWPASRPEVIAVGASTQANVRASFSNFGSKVELVAPGTTFWVDPNNFRGITSTYISGSFNQPDGCNPTIIARYRDCPGTSMAAPHVTATAALVKARFPSWTNVDIRTRLRTTVPPLPACPANECGFGLLNSLNAVL